MGIESPDGSSNPIHDHTKQYHGFGYFEYIPDDANRFSAVLSTSTGNFQIPQRAGQTPGLANGDGTPLTVSGQTTIIAQDAYKQNVADALQSDAAYRLTDAHTLRGGIFVQCDRSKSLTSSQVIALDPTTGIQTSDVPTTIIDNGAKTEWIESLYLQDEWEVFPTLTFDYGLRSDKFTAPTAF